MINTLLIELPQRFESCKVVSQLHITDNIILVFSFCPLNNTSSFTVRNLLNTCTFLVRYRQNINKYIWNLLTFEIADILEFPEFRHRGIKHGANKSKISLETRRYFVLPLN